MNHIPRRVILPGLLVCAAVSLAACGEDGQLCEPLDSAELSRALAAPEDCPTVRLQGTRYEGSFLVRSGVSLEGQGATISGSGDAVLRLEGGTDASPTRTSGLRISNEGVGVLALGRGHILLEDLTVDTRSVVGIIAEGLDGVAMRGVQIRGNVTEETLPFLGDSIDFEEFPIAALILARTGQADLQDIEISGFAGFGAVFFETGGQWRGGAVEACVGSGVFLENSDMTLEDLRLSEGMRGEQLGFQLLSTGILNTGGGHLTTRGVQVAGYNGFGIFQDSATSAHTDLQLLDNRDEGIWVQNSSGSGDTPALSLDGTNLLRANRGAGIFMHESRGLTLEGVEIADTGLKITITNQATQEIGDGLQLIGLEGEVRLRDVTLTDNSRVGMLFDGTNADELPSFDLEEVLVQGAENPEAFGLLVQNYDEALDLSAVQVEDALAERDADAPTLAISIPLQTVTTIAPLAEGGLIGNSGLLTEEGRVAQAGIVTETGLVTERDEE